MSFILDALKKSEAERLRKDAPGIAGIPESGGKKSSSKWIWLVLVLVVVNLAVLGGLVFKGQSEPTVVDTPVTTIVDEAGETPAASIPEIVIDTDRGQPESEPKTPDPGTPAPSIAIQQTGTVNDGLETFNDLRAKGILMLPDMHLDIHVYSGQPADRFVFVNMSKYKENATLTEGPVVSEITPDGVVLRYQGTSFLLPRE
jgi:general secretion pathway protein B